MLPARKPDSDNKFTSEKKVMGLHPAQQALLALVFVLLMLVTPGPVINAVKDWLSLPVLPSVDSGFPMDKVIHFLMFAICAFLSFRAWSLHRSMIFMLAAMLLFAAITEIMQTIVPGRSGDLTDFLADVLGIMMGLWWFRRVSVR